MRAESTEKARRGLAKGRPRWAPDADRPSENRLPLFSVDYLKLVGDGNEGKERRPRLIQEQLRGMRGHLEIANVFVVLRIDDSDFSVVFSRIFAAVAYIDQLGIRFVDNAVGPRLKLDRIEKLESVAPKHPDHSVVAACQEQLVEFRYIQHPLSLLETGNASRPLPGSQIHHLKCAILQTGQE